MRSKFKVTTWVEHPIDSHPFGFMTIHPLILMTEGFLNLTFKIQGQIHSSRSQSRHDTLLTHTPFVACWSALPFLRYSYFKNWPWKSKVKVMVEVKVQSHKVSLTSYRLVSLSFHVDRPSHSWDTTISNIDVKNSRLRSWVRSKLKVAT